MGKYVDAKVCSRCGWYGYPKKESDGSWILCIVLWFLFLLPGLIYMAWMFISEKEVCGSCHSRELIAPSSPVGLELLHRHHPELFAK